MISSYFSFCVSWLNVKKILNLTYHLTTTFVFKMRVYSPCRWCFFLRILVKFKKYVESLLWSVLMRPNIIVKHWNLKYICLSCGNFIHCLKVILSMIYNFWYNFTISILKLKDIITLFYPAYSFDPITTKMTEIFDISNQSITLILLLALFWTVN